MDRIGREDTAVVEKLLGPDEQRRHVLRACVLLDQEATESIAGVGVKRAKPWTEANVILRLLGGKPASEAEEAYLIGDSHRSSQ